MPDRVLVAGATGALGVEVVRVLKDRGHRVIALGRDPRRLRQLASLADEHVVADVMDPRTLAGVLRGVDRVFSCLGASVIPMLRYGRTTFSRFDFPANRNLIDAARETAVRRFVYVSVFGAHKLPDQDFIKGHEMVVDHLRTSGLDFGVVRPTGFFSAMQKILLVASWGLTPQFGDGEVRTNPIHEADLAEVCAAMLFDDTRERDVGGPEALTRRELADLAFEAVGRKGRRLLVPVGLLRNTGRLLRPLNPRVGNLFTFIADILVDDFVAPAYGSRRIGDYFREKNL